MNRIIFTLLFLLASSWVYSQVNGVVYTEPAAQQSAATKQAIPGVNVFWEGTTQGTSTEPDGSFQLDDPVSYPARLVVSFVGFQNDTILLQNTPSQALTIQLKESVTLIGVQITGKTNTTNISMMEPLLTENLSRGELNKAACCNLSESFETNASIDVSMADAVSGTKKIRMLGLDGIYTQMLAENVPFLRGLAARTGISHVPGTWIESIQITKGTGSVVNGYEAITGQINIEYFKPENLENERLFINLYGNRMGRIEANAHTTQQINSRWSTLVFGHVSDGSVKNDQNSDGFLDVPLTRQYNLFNRWKYKGELFRFQGGISGTYKDLQGGQDNFDYDSDLGSNEVYGLGNQLRHAEFYTKTGFLFRHRPGRSIGVIVNGRIHDQESYFGTQTYTGREDYLWANAINQMHISDTRHTLKSGLSYKYDRYQETLSDSSFSRTESVPGVFSEYEYSDGAFSLVAGFRADYHNLYDWFLTPRLHLKYLVSEGSALRLSGGRGYRVANAVNENLSLLASSRQFTFLGDLDPEEAWNTGISSTNKFRIAGREAFFNADYFLTWFTNQIVIDLENPRLVRFYNLNGESFSHSLQLETGIEPIDRLDVKLAYKWYDVQVDFLEGRRTRPLVPRHRAMANVGYATIGEKWLFDVTVNWIGTMRVPSTAINSEVNQRPEESETYALLNAQITKKFRKWDVYAGGENLTAYTQDDPIIGASDPFGTEFDASLVWAPINAPVVYAGFRFKL